MLCEPPRGRVANPVGAVLVPARAEIESRPASHQVLYPPLHLLPGHSEAHLGFQWSRATAASFSCPNLWLLLVYKDKQVCLVRGVCWESVCTIPLLLKGRPCLDGGTWEVSLSLWSLPPCFPVEGNKGPRRKRPPRGLGSWSAGAALSQAPPLKKSPLCWCSVPHM